jgi:lysosomal acid lipase/cholesteryl ester hydrolase
MSGHDDLLSYKTKERFSTSLFCRYSPTCEHLIFNLGAEDRLNYDPAVLMKLTGFLPAGTSTRTARHFTQLVTAKYKFQKYDYGRDKNLRVYGNQQPPVYNLSAITTPIGIFYSDADFVVTTADVERTFSELKETIGLFKIKAKKFGHNEFTLGRRAAEMINRPILQMLEDFR